MQKTKIINLLGYDVRIFLSSASSIYVDVPAEKEQNQAHVGTHIITREFINLDCWMQLSVEKYDIALINLPESIEGVIYLTTREVAEEARKYGRKDVFAPGPPRRFMATTLGYDGLIRP